MSQNHRAHQLSNAELARYSRQLLLPELGKEGQEKLKQARVLVVGAGGLGCPAGLYLAAAGVGTIGLVDFDAVDVSNLHRQILYCTDDVGIPKVQAAEQRLRRMNEHIEVRTYQTRISAADVCSIVEHYDIVIDGTDNFATRYLLNDTCVILRKPYVYGSIFRFDGQASVFTHETGCYRCLFPVPPPPEAVPNCAEAGVLGALPGIIGSIQATEAMKIVLGLEGILTSRLVLFDALTMRFDELTFKRNPECTVCGDSPSISKPMDLEVACAAPPPAAAPTEITVEKFVQMTAKGSSNFTLLDVRQPNESEICKLTPSVLIPLPELEERLDELDKAMEVIAYCRSGARSLAAVQILREHGFKAKSLAGGILAWVESQDPSMPRY